MKATPTRAPVRAGQVYGKLTVLGLYQQSGGKGRWRTRVHCRCACGHECSVRLGDLTRDNPTQSCGCRTMKLAIGNAVGHLTVTAFEVERSGKRTRRMAVCACVCGRTRRVQIGNLMRPTRSGGARSCGNQACRPKVSREYPAPLSKNLNVGLMQAEWDALHEEAERKGVALCYLVRTKLGLTVPARPQPRKRNGAFAAHTRKGAAA